MLHEAGKRRRIIGYLIVYTGFIMPEQRIEADRQGYWKDSKPGSAELSTEMLTDRVKKPARQRLSARH